MSSSYRVVILDRAKKELAAISPPDRRRVTKYIDALVENPTPSNSKAMKGEFAGYYRVRCGNYRVLYSIQRNKLIIVVIRIGHRREVYRQDASAIVRSNGPLRRQIGTEADNGNREGRKDSAHHQRDRHGAWQQIQRPTSRSIASSSMTMTVRHVFTAPSPRTCRCA